MSGEEKSDHHPPEEPPAPSTSAIEKPIDEKLFRAYELYLSERTRLSGGKQEQSKAYDQTILTFSAGAVALSFTFLEKVVKNPNAKGLLYTSWIFFGAAIVSTIYSHLTSQKAFEGEIDDLDTRYRQLTGLPAEDTPSPTSPMTAWGVTLMWQKTFAAMFKPTLNFFRKAVKFLNWCSGAFFFFGLISFGWFALENWVFIKKEPKAVATTKSPTDVKVVAVRPVQPGDRHLPPITPTVPPKVNKP
ncbi:MAG TPA: hypothetical protein VKB93_24365 [Thermoanaerobaculia bacterium]|nr:hypothetical protein [Thermoanaerobaculia bacterium]